MKLFLFMHKYSLKYYLYQSSLLKSYKKEDDDNNALIYRRRIGSVIRQRWRSADRKRKGHQWRLTGFFVNNKKKMTSLLVERPKQKYIIYTYNLCQHNCFLMVLSHWEGNLSDIDDEELPVRVSRDSFEWSEHHNLRRNRNRKNIRGALRHTATSYQQKRW